MKIYTKTGDRGETSLLGGKRVKKFAQRIATYGTVDELNSHIGMLRDLSESAQISSQLIGIQNQLFTIGSHLASDPKKPFQGIPELNADILVKDLENFIDAMDAELSPMQNFILPGGHMAVSQAHITRCVCRRAEREVLQLASEEQVDAPIAIYLNRLSDYLFVLSRFLTKQFGAEEIPWLPKKDNS